MNYKLINEYIDNISYLEQVLYNRGIPLNEIEHYCNTDYLDILNPELINNIKSGAKMLIQHISVGNKTYIQVDCDADGYTSSALLINYLYILFPKFVEENVIWGLHKKKEHGIDLDFLPEDTKLIIVPDASSNEYDLHEELHSKGIDILIIDHHEATCESPNACVINNQLDNYPNKTLSGVGMVYKFCSYLDSLLNLNVANYFLDLVAVGMVADMMDMRSFETKELIRRGFAQIRNPFIKGVIDKDQFHFSGEVTQHKIAFYLVPLINAVTRVGNLDDKNILFESMLEHKADKLIPSTKRGEKGKQEKIVTQAIRMCTNTKKAQDDKKKEYSSMLEILIEENNLLQHKILLICLNPENAPNANLTGLIANTIAPKYQRPTLILNKIEEEGTVKYAGSARNFPNSPIKSFKDFVTSTNKIIYAEGHANAFGFAIEEKNIEDFLQMTDNLLKNIEFTPTYYVDFIFNANENLYNQAILDLGSADDLWGQEVAEPLIVIEGVKVNKDNITLMSKDKNPTLKITTPTGLDIIKFKSNEEEFNKLFTLTGYIEINVVGTCNINSWLGNINPQLLVEDYEIIKKQNFYF